MPKYMSLLKCLNCGNYTAGQKMLHRDDCGGAVVVEVITQKVGVYCLGCGGMVGTEPRKCVSCGDMPFGPVYKDPTASRMEEYVHVLMDALAKSQGKFPHWTSKPRDRSDDLSGRPERPARPGEKS